jgi:vitamin B12 transporter
MKIIAAFLLTFLFSLAAFAQTNSTSVSGKITQDAGNVVVTNASVSLVSQSDSQLKFTAATDDAGNYRFENVSPGKYTLTASANGARENGVWQQTAVTVSAGENIVINLNLETYGGVKEVVTIAAGTAQTVDEISKSVSVLGDRELQDRDEISISDALRTVPGLRVQQLGGFGRAASVKTRGLRNQDTAVLIDGQRFRDPSFITGSAESFLGDLTITNLEKIEVLRGSGSSLYGTNAIGGVFNIKTDEGGGRPRVSLLGEGGGLGFFRGRANFTGGLNADKFRYSFGISHNNFGKGVDGDDAARNTSGQGRVTFALPKNATVSARFLAADAFTQLNSNPDTIGSLPTTGIIEARPLARSELRRFETGTPRNALARGDATFVPDANDPDASQASRFFVGSVVFNQAVNEKISYSLSYQSLLTRRKNINGAAGVGFQPFGGASRSIFDGNIQTARARADFQIGKFNLVTAGYEFEWEKFGNDNFTPSGVGNNAVDARQRSNTIFVQDQIEAFGRRLQISGAFRAQWFSLGKPGFSGARPAFQNASFENPPTAYTADGSAAYFFRSTGTKLRAHVGNGYRVPSLFERFGSFYTSFLVPQPQFTALGDPRLKPERSVAFDAGIDQNFERDRVRLSATLFYTRLIDVIGFNNSLQQPDPFGRFSGYFNTRGGMARGGEFSAEIKPLRATDLFASYTVTNSDQRQPQVAASGTVQTLGIPAHQFTLVATQRIFDRVTVNFDFVGTSSYLAPIFSNADFRTRVFRFKGSRKGDLTASFDVPTGRDKLRARLFGKIENIFNQDYYENGFRTARATARGGVQLNF